MSSRLTGFKRTREQTSETSYHEVRLAPIIETSPSETKCKYCHVKIYDYQNVAEYGDLYKSFSSISTCIACNSVYHQKCLKAWHSHAYNDQQLPPKVECCPACVNEESRTPIVLYNSVSETYEHIVTAPGKTNSPSYSSETDEHYQPTKKLRSGFSAFKPFRPQAKEELLPPAVEYEVSVPAPRTQFKAKDAKYEQCIAPPQSFEPPVRDSTLRGVSLPSIHEMMPTFSLDQHLSLPPVVSSRQDQRHFARPQIPQVPSTPRVPQTTPVFRSPAQPQQLQKPPTPPATVLATSNVVLTVPQEEEQIDYLTKARELTSQEHADDGLNCVIQ